MQPQGPPTSADTPPGRARADWSPLGALDWFDREGRFASSAGALLDGLSRELLAAGAPVIRTRFSFQTLHPLLRVVTVKWWPDRGASDELGSGHGLEVQPKFVGSPVEAVFATGQPFRRRLAALEPGVDHRVLFEIRDEGGSDYLAVPVRFAGPEKGMFAAVCGAGHSFTDRQVAEFRILADRIAPAVEALIQRRIARTLLETYVGRRSGARVLRGQVRRGDAEAVRAAFWYSDLENFTPMTEARPMDEVLAVVNRFVEITWAEARVRGGEVVNLVGDAVLMMFPASAERDAGAACSAALDAARATLAAAADDARLRFGIGLHFGEAIYGNIGAPDRLDFTVMGAAVNRTARLEALTRELGEPLLASAEFMGKVDSPARPCGRHPVKGVSEHLEVFAPALG